MSPEHIAAARKLADVSEAAAASHPEHRWLQAILKERGDIALASGDKPAAEKAWSRMLDTILADASDRRVSLPIRAPTTTSGPPQSGRSALEELRQRLLNKTPDPGMAPLKQAQGTIAATIENMSAAFAQRQPSL